MLNERIEKVQGQFGTVYGTVTGTAHKAFQAGLGVFTLTQEQVADLLEKGLDFTDELVERGDKVQANGRERVNHVVDGRRSQVKELVEKVETSFNDMTKTVLDRANVPSADSIETLTKQVNALSKKVDQLKKAQEKSA